MEWGYFFAWCAVIFALFWLTGYPVTPMLQGYWGNHYQQQDLVYFSILYIHYFIGALFFAFLGLGLFRTLIWKGVNGGTKQIAWLLAYSFLISSVFGVIGVHLLMPDGGNTGDVGEGQSGGQGQEEGGGVA